jgi:putative phosphoribosyl transferase
MIFKNREEAAKLLAEQLRPLYSGKNPDEVVCLDSPHFFSSVGEFYVDFPQVSDDEVVDLLKKQ